MGSIPGMIQGIAIIVVLYSNSLVSSASQPMADAMQEAELDQSSVESADPPSDATVTPWLAEQLVISDSTLPHLPALTGRVVDEAEIIDPADEQALTTQLAMYESDTTNQIVVVTVTSLRGMPIEKFSLELANYWGIGQRGKNNGVVLVVAHVDRKVRIEVGLGLQDTLTDAVAASIIEDVMIPHFRSGQLSLGILSGSTSIIGAIGRK